MGKDLPYWVIIPAYNEAARLGQVLKGLKLYTKNIIVVDDGSLDNTQTIARRHTPHVLTHLTNLGKGAALKTGCVYAFSHLKAAAVIFIDADGQHLPSDLPQFLQDLKAGHQIVFGVRPFTKAMPFVRRWSNLSISWLIQLLYGKYIPDIPSGFKALSMAAYQVIKWESADYAVELEIAIKTARAGLDYTTVPIHTIYYPTDRGMSALDALKSLTKVIEWRLKL